MIYTSKLTKSKRKIVISENESIVPIKAGDYIERVEIKCKQVSKTIDLLKIFGAIFCKVVRFSFKEGNRLEIGVDSNDKKIRAMCGTLHALVFNALSGLRKPFSVTLEILGNEYSVVKNGEYIDLFLGHSHGLRIKSKEENGIYTVVEGKKLIVYADDKQLLGNHINRLQSLRERSHYKAKGLHDTSKPLIIKERAKQESSSGKA